MRSTFSLAIPAPESPLEALPPGKYLISVTADGYKIDDAHFTIDGGTQRVTVSAAHPMQRYPLPLGNVRIRVFNDSVPVDATYEVGAESGLAGSPPTFPVCSVKSPPTTTETRCAPSMCTPHRTRLTRQARSSSPAASHKWTRPRPESASVTRKATS
jgi:hypothetical protein